MIRIPATAWLDSRWNTCLDLADALGISRAELAAAWDAHGPEWVLVMLRTLTAAGTEIATTETEKEAI